MILQYNMMFAAIFRDRVAFRVAEGDWQHHADGRGYPGGQWGNQLTCNQANTIGDFVASVTSEAREERRKAPHAATLESLPVVMVEK